jgi:hypothetical protein
MSAFKGRMSLFTGEARLSGQSDDLSWDSEIGSRLKAIEFFSVVFFFPYEDAPTLSFSYFKIGGISLRLLGFHGPADLRFGAGAAHSLDAG